MKTSLLGHLQTLILSVSRFVNLWPCTPDIPLYSGWIPINRFKYSFFFLLQTRRVHPSVPELSMVLDGSFLDASLVNTQDSTPVPHSLSNIQRRSISPAHQGLSVLRPPEQSSIPGPPPIRRPLTPILSQPKNKLHPNPGQQTPQPNASRKSLPSIRRSRDGSSASSVSSSSSSSSTKNASSPNGSFHQQRHRSSQGFPTKTQTIYSGPPTSGHSSTRKSSVMPSQTPIPHPSQHRLFHSTPAANPCSCCTNQPTHVPMYQNNWQGPPVYPTVVHNPCGFHCGAESVPPGDHCLSPSRQSLGCRISPTKSPVCHPAVPVHHSPSPSPCVPTVNPNKGSVDQVPSCQAQCCQVQDTPLCLLPADAYRMLMDQERQLKLLQLQVCISLLNVSALTCHCWLLTDFPQQIQKLLESQSKTTPVSSGEHDAQQERANQTQTSPPKQTSVSVAVGTGNMMEGCCIYYQFLSMS